MEYVSCIIMCGAWGEVPEDTYALLQAMTRSRVRVTGPSTGKKGPERTERGKCQWLLVTYRGLQSVATVKAQLFPLRKT